MFSTKFSANNHNQSLISQTKSNQPYRVYPDIFRLLFHYESSLNPNVLELVDKQFYRGVQAAIYSSDLITTMQQDLSANELDQAIEAYSLASVFKRVSKIPINALNPWLFLTLSITKHSPTYEDRLAMAVFSVMRRMSPEKLKYFIRNYRRTPSCKALLLRISHSKNPGHIENICEALLCDDIMKLDCAGKLKPAIEHIISKYIGSRVKFSYLFDNYPMISYDNRSIDPYLISILEGLVVTMLVVKGYKHIPSNADFYINLRGANLMAGKKFYFKNINFQFTELQSAKFNGAHFADDLSMIYYIPFTLLFSLAAYLNPFQNASNMYVRIASRTTLSIGYFLPLWFVKKHTGKSVFKDVDLSNANFEGALLGDTIFDNVHLEGANLPIAWMASADFKSAHLLNRLSLENIDETLDQIVARTNVKSYHEKVAREIIETANHMPKVVATKFLQKAIDHGFFTPENKRLSLIQHAGNIALLFSSGVAFFQSFTLQGKPMLEAALENISNDPDHDAKIGIKRVSLVPEKEQLNNCSYTTIRNVHC